MMNEREYNKLKRAIEAEYHRKLEALEMVWRMSGGAFPTDSKPAGLTLGRGSTLNAVRSVLEDLQGEFTLRDVAQEITAKDPAFVATMKRSSISSTLKRLAEKGEIELVAAGSGKRASRYRVVR